MKSQKVLYLPHYTVMFYYIQTQTQLGNITF